MIDAKIMSAILLDMFEFAPVAISVSTTGADTSRYVQVNSAYLRLTGKSWDDLHDQDMLTAGSAIPSLDRDPSARPARRGGLLQVGGGSDPPCERDHHPDPDFGLAWRL